MNSRTNQKNGPVILGETAGIPNSARERYLGENLFSPNFFAKGNTLGVLP